jgi:DNA-binding MarR family transcriptional regulator
MAKVKVGKALAVSKRRSLQVIGRWVSRTTRESVEDLGVSSEQAEVLQVLVERGPQTLSAIAHVLSLDFSVAVRVVRRLVGKDLAVRRDPVEGSGSARRAVALTEGGRRLSQEVSERWETGFAQVLAAVPMLGERTSAYELSALLASAMQTLEQGAPLVKGTPS